VRIYTTLVLVFILLAIAFIFGSQNDEIISLNYLIARTEISIATAVSLFTAIGFTLGILLTILWRLIRKGKKALIQSKES